MIRKILSALMALCLLSATETASAQACPTLPNTLTNGTAADATQVMANFNYILNCANAAAANSAAGFRNRIINGDMRIDQRNAGAAQTFTAAAAAAYSVDRFYGFSTGANVTGQRVSGTGADQYVYQFAGVASTTGITLGQRIEATNIYDLANTTATFSVELANSLLTTVTWTAYYANTTDTWSAKTQIATGTFPVNSTLARKSVQIPLGAFAGNGVAIELSVGAQTSGTWKIGQFQLETGSIATAFERRPIGTEISLSQRYYEKSFPLATGPAQNLGYSSSGAFRAPATRSAAGVNYLPSVPFRVEKRVAPAIVVTFNPFAANAQVRDSTMGVDFSSTSTVTSATSILIYAVGNASTSVGNALDIAWTVDAEL